MSFSPLVDPYVNTRMDVSAEDLQRIEDNAVDADARLTVLESLSPVILIETDEDLPLGIPSGYVVVVTG